MIPVWLQDILALVGAILLCGTAWFFVIVAGVERLP
jgi:hypothetical protein